MWVLRAAAKMFLTLGLAGTFVAVIGLYGVRSYLVSRRTREFGVRMAIGASPVDVLRLVVRESLATTTVGLTIGLGLGTLLGWGIAGSDLSDQPARSGDSGSRHRHSCDSVVHRVNHSGPTGCLCFPDDFAQKRLTHSLCCVELSIGRTYRLRRPGLQSADMARRPLRRSLLATHRRVAAVHLSLLPIARSRSRPDGADTDRPFRG